jgi:hypothetical protein
MDKAGWKETQKGDNEIFGNIKTKKDDLPIPSLKGSTPTQL